MKFASEKIIWVTTAGNVFPALGMDDYHYSYIISPMIINNPINNGDIIMGIINGIIIGDIIIINNPINNPIIIMENHPF